MRRFPIKVRSFLEHVRIPAFINGIFKMPEGNSQRMPIWGLVIISSVAINQYRLYRNDAMQAQNEA